MIPFLTVAVPYFVLGFIVSLLTMKRQWRRAEEDFKRRSMCWDFCDDTLRGHVKHRSVSMMITWGWTFPKMLINDALDRAIDKHEPIERQIERLEKEQLGETNSLPSETNDPPTMAEPYQGHFINNKDSDFVPIYISPFQ
jgi:hypothetical protein